MSKVKAKKKTEKKIPAQDIKLESALVPEDEQPYKVPDNWVWVRLRDIKKDNNAFFDGDWILSENMDTNGGVRLIQLSDIGIGKFLDKSSRFISEKTFNDLQCSELHEGDVLISRMAEPIARSCIMPKLEKKCITAVDVAVLRCNKFIVENQYINWLCNNTWFTEIAEKQARGTTRVRITRNNLGKIPCPLPPLAEQKRIIRCIENLFNKLDRAQELAQSAIDSFETRKAAILHKAFTGELTAKWRKENGIKFESWEQTTLGQHVSILGDGIHGTPKYNDNGSYYFINGNNLSGFSIEIKPDTKKIDEIEYKKHKKELNNTTVLVSINGTLGNTAFFNNEPVILGKSACYFNVLNSLDKNFIRYYLKTKEYLDYANFTATGSTIKNLSLKAMRNLPLSLPSLPEQQEIVRILDCLFEKERRARELCGVIGKIDLMKKAILARAFRGELGTNVAGEGRVRVGDEG